MLEDIKKFYEKTKLDADSEESEPSEAPITWIKVFYKEYPRLPSITLPETQQEGELARLLAERESTRNFSNEPVTLKELAQIIRSCRIVDPNRDPERRTYPSGGARFPVEVYLVSFNIEELKPGAYHYNIKKGTLELLWEKDLRDKEEEIVSPSLKNSAAAIILTSVVARSEVKYGHKAYPYSLIEAGHVGQNLQLMCTKLNIGSCSIGGFVNDTISKVLDLTDNEIPLYVIGLGKKEK